MVEAGWLAGMVPDVQPCFLMLRRSAGELGLPGPDVLGGMYTMLRLSLHDT
jgi:hypothetical protein